MRSDKCLPEVYIDQENVLPDQFVPNLRIARHCGYWVGRKVRHIVLPIVCMCLATVGGHLGLEFDCGGCENVKSVEFQSRSAP